MIHLDTSVLLDCLSGRRKSQSRLTEFVATSERVQISTLVLYEWRRGPRVPVEIENQELLFPSDKAVGFSSAEAIIAADLYRRVKRARGREIDLAIAACAMAHHARLWTLNREDFKDIPNLELI